MAIQETRALDRNAQAGANAAALLPLAAYFKAPFPARSTIEVAGLPRGAAFEVDAVLVLE